MRQREKIMILEARVNALLTENAGLRLELEKQKNVLLTAKLEAIKKTAKPIGTPT